MGLSENQGNAFDVIAFVNEVSVTITSPTCSTILRDDDNAQLYVGVAEESDAFQDNFKGFIYEFAIM